MKIEFGEVQQTIFGDAYVDFTDPNGVCEINGVYVYYPENQAKRIYFTNLRQQHGTRHRFIREIPKELITAWEYATMMKELGKRLQNIRVDVPEKELP